MEYFGWICPNCNRALVSSTNDYSKLIRIKCRLCFKSSNINSVIKSKPSFDPELIRAWVVNSNSI